nr:retrovirus-related Pol polyprotein from transposon TNT 1-94 [Tanacetum cinerariifolium]
STSSQADPKIQKDYKAKYKKMKVKLAHLEASPSTSQTPKTFQPKNKGLVAETFDWDEKEVSDDEEVTHVKVLMALADDELTVGKGASPSLEVESLTLQPYYPKERPGLGIMKHTKPEIQDYLNKSISGTVTVSETESTTPSFPTGIKNTEQESKLNELTKLVQMLMDEKINTRLMNINLSHLIQEVHPKGGVLAESSQSSESSIDVKCNTCGSTVHSITDRNEFDHFKRGFDLKGYPDSDYAGCNMDRKSTLETKVGLEIVTICGNYSSTEQVNSIQHLFAYCLLTGTKDESFGSSPTNLSNSYFSKDPSKVIPIELTDFMVVANKLSSGIVPDPQDPERNIQLTSMGFPSTLDEGTRKSKHFPEGTNIDPRDSEGNVQPADRGLPFMASDKGAVKTMSFPEGPRGEKDSEGLKPPADIEPQTNHVADPLGTGAKYHVDETQYTRLSERQLVKYLKKEQIDKVIDAAMNSLDKNSIAKGDILNALNGITETLKTIQDAIKEDLVHNKKNLGPRMTSVESSQAKIRSEISSLKQDTSEIKFMMTEIFQAFKGQSSAPSSNMPQTTLAITKRQLNVRGENVTQANTKEPPFYTEREHVSMEDDAKKPKLDKAEKEPTKVVPISIVRPITRPNHEVIMIESSSRPPLTDPTLEIHVPQRKGNEKEDNIKKAAEEAKMFEMTMTEKAQRAMKLRKKRFEQYMWTTSCRIRPEPITDFKIHPNTKPAVLDVYKVNDKRNFQVHNPFKFIDFRLTEQDGLGPIIQNKKNTTVKDLMTSLVKRYERLKKIPEELRMQSLPKGVPFVNNMVIEEPECGIFFTDVFGDQAFQIWNDTHKVGVDSLVSYLVMASMVKTPENAKFGLKLKKLIVEHHDQEKLKSKKVKLEAL